jgi:tetratricopeptide (TPR) repeat protein
VPEDDIRSLSATLARNPGSLAYAELADALRRRGQCDEALGIALHGLARHPQHADGHDVLARIYADLGDLDRARVAWSRTLDLAPEHGGALRGLGFVLFRQGAAAEATATLEKALALNPSDDAVRRALEMVRRTADGEIPDVAPPEDAAEPGLEGPRSGAAKRPAVFRGFDRATEDILLVDERGLLVAGGIADVAGRDVSELASAGLAGVSGEASRAADYLHLGSWRTIVAEAQTANLVVAPVGKGALLLVRRDRSMPVGLALRFAERARGVARAWLERQGA